MIAPRGGFFTRDGKWAVENEGVAPDIDVENWPKDVIAGRDPQLERAVQEAMRLLKEKPVNRMMKEPPSPRVGEAEGRILVTCELEFRIEEGDVDAFLDHHSQHSAARREIRRRQLYGYVILFAIFGLVFRIFGETAVAIAFLVLGPAWAAWWPTRARRLARQQAADFYRAAPNYAGRRPARPQAGRGQSLSCRARR